jgi:8-oxo-dGTP diphosphatase
VQLRAKSLSTAAYVELAKQVKQCCQQYGARLVLNADPALVSVVGADGVHLSGERLNALQQRPLDKSYLLGVSCHSRQDIERASKVAVDFAVLSPVAQTASHPHAVPLGWAAFQALADGADFPVYALGGMGLKDLDEAYAHGAQGIAAIRALWASR